VFEAAELGRRVSRDEYRAELPALRAALTQAQQRLRGSPFSVLVIVEGVEGVGRGEVVNRLNGWLDSRGTETHAFWDVSSEDASHPRYWRYWRALPARGRMGLFFGAWYSEPLVRGCQGEWDDARVETAAARIRDMERMLAMDGHRDPEVLVPPGQARCPAAAAEGAPGGSGQPLVARGRRRPAPGLPRLPSRGGRAGDPRHGHGARALVSHRIRGCAVPGPHRGAHPAVRPSASVPGQGRGGT
jgi:hypothetical protein